MSGIVFVSTCEALGPVIGVCFGDVDHDESVSVTVELDVDYLCRCGNVDHVDDGTIDTFIVAV